MVALFNRGSQAQDGGDAGSLRERFRAWWDGDEILEPSAEPAPAQEPEPKHEVHYEVKMALPSRGGHGPGVLLLEARIPGPSGRE